MATTHAKRTLASQSSNYKEWLADLYTYFNGVSTNWQIKVGATIPAQITAIGDQGFVIEDVATQTINVAFGAPAAVGSTLISGAAVAGSDDPLIGIDPGGGITDITAGGFTAGARWSKWAINADGNTYSSWLTYKIVDAADYFAIRTKTTATGFYDGGCFAGKYLSFAARHSGYAVLAGTWLAQGTATSANTGTYELDSAGRWSASGTLCVVSANTVSLTANQASDGAGAYNYSRCALTSYTTPSGLGGPFGLLPHQFHSVIDAAGKRWTVAAAVTMVNLNGGSWLWLDDGVNAE